MGRIPVIFATENTSTFLMKNWRFFFLPEKLLQSLTMLNILQYR